jgi:hypothetical protein
MVIFADGVVRRTAFFGGVPETRHRIGVTSYYRAEMSRRQLFNRRRNGRRICEDVHSYVNWVLISDWYFEPTLF